MLDELLHAAVMRAAPINAPATRTLPELVVMLPGPGGEVFQSDLLRDRLQPVMAAST